YFTINVVGRIDQANQARIILRYISSGVAVVGKLDQVNRVRLVEPAEAELHQILLPIGRQNRLRPNELRRGKVRADRRAVVTDWREKSRRLIDPLVSARRFIQA